VRFFEAGAAEKYSAQAKKVRAYIIPHAMGKTMSGGWNDGFISLSNIGRPIMLKAVAAPAVISTLTRETRVGASRNFLFIFSSVFFKQNVPQIPLRPI
jgi:hypothetical protein